MPSPTQPAAVQASRRVQASRPASQPSKARPAQPAGYMGGPEFKAARLALGMTVAELAAVLGYDRGDTGPASAGESSVIRWQRFGPPVPAARIIRLLLAGGPAAKAIRGAAGESI